MPDASTDHRLFHWPRAIVHLDMDTFFVSVERLNDPSLEGKPVIVGGGRDGDHRRGVVAACSYETRRFGVHSAMPLVQALRLCPDAIVVPVGTSDYRAHSRKVRAVIESFTDHFEMASLDEAYIDLAGTESLHGPPIAAAHRLRMNLRAETGLPVSVGLGRSRAIAKIASKLSKPRGLFVIFPGAEPAIVRPLKLRALPGLGPKTTARLESFGIKTLGQLLDLGEDRTRALLGDHGVDLIRRARGEGSAEIESDRERLQISIERTFREDIGDPARIRTLLAQWSAKLAAQVRDRGQWAGTATLKLRYPDFTTLTRQTPLNPPSQDDRVILRAALHLFESHWNRDRPLRLLGVGLANFTTTLQPDLFGDAADSTDPQKKSQPAHETSENTDASRQPDPAPQAAALHPSDPALIETLDRVRAKLGPDAITWGSALDVRKGRKRGAREND